MNYPSFKSRWARSLLIIWVLAPCVGCSLLEKKDDNDADLVALTKAPLKPDQAKEIVSDVGQDWLYGEGVGNAALQVGATVMFPPYGLVVLGNAALEYKGYKPIGVSTALPEGERQEWSKAYDSVVSVPGRLAASAAGEDFRTPEESSAKIKQKIMEMQAANEKERRARLGKAQSSQPVADAPHLILPKQPIPDDY